MKNQLSKHEKKIRTQKRQQKRGFYTNEREKRNAILRANAHRKAKKFISQGVSQPPGMKVSLRAKIWHFIQGLKIIFCKLGWHIWAEHSGLPGTAKYYCPRCTQFSKEVWKERKSVGNKFAPQVGKPIVWETYSGKRYKGILIKLNGKIGTVQLEDGSMKEIDLP